MTTATATLLTALATLRDSSSDTWDTCVETAGLAPDGTQDMARVAEAAAAREAALGLWDLAIEAAESQDAAGAIEALRGAAGLASDWGSSEEEDQAIEAIETSARTYRLRQDDVWYAEVEAEDVASALAEAEGNVSRSDYPDCEGTLYIDVEAWCEFTDESATSTVTLDPEEPECPSGEGHDWQSPEFLGGCAENPGVLLHGGGVIIARVCMRCGCGRHTDTWAQRRDTGEQGLTEVRYEPGEYADEIEARAQE